MTMGLEDLERLKEAVIKLTQEKEPTITIQVADEVFVLEVPEAFWAIMALNLALAQARRK